MSETIDPQAPAKPANPSRTAPQGPFGKTENKSLESEVAETKDIHLDTPVNITPPDTGGDDDLNRDRVRALHHLTLDGVDIVPGTEFDVHTRIASRLVAANHAVRV